MSFPTYKEILDYKNDLPYVQNWSGDSALNDVRVVPLKSNPAAPDSGGDGIVDDVEYFKSDAYKNLTANEKELLKGLELILISLQ